MHVSPAFALTPADTTTLTYQVLAIHPVRQGRLLAFADVALTWGGLEITLQGLQIRTHKSPDGKQLVSVHLPQHRSGSGQPQQSIILPDELNKPLGDAVTAAAAEAGLFRL